MTSTGTFDAFAALGKQGAPILIAEIGVNFNGDLELARDSIAAAAAAGADIVKFQSFRAAEVVGSEALLYDHGPPENRKRESMLDLLRRLELPFEWHAELQKQAQRHGVCFLSTATDPVSADALAAIDVPAIKIASADVINLPLLRHVGATGIPIILSTGMADEAEVDFAVETLRGAGTQALMLLHCVSLYPTPDDQANLRRIRALAGRYDVPVGYSDHTQGIEAALAATALGAVLIEKHFTLDRRLPGPDHALSADPAEFAALAAGVRRVACQLGSDALAPAAGEAVSRRDFRRSIVAARDLPTGTVLEPAHLALRRPGTGLHPRQLDALIGRRMQRALAANEPLAFSDLDDPS